MGRVTIARLDEAATARGGACVEEMYLGWGVEHRWRCAEGHEWLATPRRVLASGRTWCPECAGVARGDLERLRRCARERGGECLSRRYVNNNSPLRWQCARGHRWAALPRAILAGHWCWFCANRDRPGRRLTLDELQETAAAMGGRCLARTYENNRQPLPWVCAEGHEFVATARSVRQGSWCKVCSGLDAPPLEKFRRIAESRGGVCLSERYVNSRSKLRLRCAEGHEWSALPHSLVAGSWCRACAGAGRRAAER